MHGIYMCLYYNIYFVSVTHKDPWLLESGMLEFPSSILWINWSTMSDKTSFISQIQKEEEEAAKMLKQLEEDNGKRVLKATEEADLMVLKAEEEEREKARAVILKAKEESKAAYGKLLTDANNARRDIIGTGKTKIPAGKKTVIEAFMAMFE